jgi:hypothetical protein
MQFSGVPLSDINQIKAMASDASKLQPFVEKIREAWERKPALLKDKPRQSGAGVFSRGEDQRRVIRVYTRLGAERHPRKLGFPNQRDQDPVENTSDRVALFIGPGKSST